MLLQLVDEKTEISLSMFLILQDFLIFFFFFLETQSVFVCAQLTY